MWGNRLVPQLATSVVAHRDQRRYPQVAEVCDGIDARRERDCAFGVTTQLEVVDDQRRLFLIVHLKSGMPETRGVTRSGVRPGPVPPRPLLHIAAKSVTSWLLQRRGERRKCVACTDEVTQGREQTASCTVLDSGISGLALCS